MRTSLIKPIAGVLVLTLMLLVVPFAAPSSAASLGVECYIRGEGSIRILDSGFAVRLFCETNEGDWRNPEIYVKGLKRTAENRIVPKEFIPWDYSLRDKCVVENYDPVRPSERYDRTVFIAIKCGDQVTRFQLTAPVDDGNVPVLAVRAMNGLMRFHRFQYANGQSLMFQNWKWGWPSWRV